MSTVGAAPGRRRTDVGAAVRDRRTRRADSRTVSTVSADRADSHVVGLTRVLAVLCCLLAPVPGLGYSVTLGAPLGLLVLPSTVRWLSSRLHRALAVALVATVVTAPVVSLVALAVAPDRSFELRGFVKELGTFVALVGVASGIVHGSRTLGLLPAAALAGAGATANQLLRPEVADETLWKFRLAWAVPVLVLAVLGRAPRPAQLTAVVALGAVAAVSASRNNLAALGTAGAVVVVSMLLLSRGTAAPTRGRVVAGSVLALGIPAAAVSVLPALFASGEFGRDIQRRTVNQLDAAGFLGGRFEYGASFALFGHDPWGYGPGVIASQTDLLRAADGLRAIGVDYTSGGYREQYVLDQLLADNFRLHSVAAEFWLRGGPVALLAAALVVVVLLRGLALAITYVGAGGTALLGFCCTQSLWDVLFSPVRPNGVWIFVTVGLCVAVVSTARRAKDPPDHTEPSVAPPVRAMSPAAGIPRSAARQRTLSRRGRGPTARSARRTVPRRTPSPLSRPRHAAGPSRRAPLPPPRRGRPSR